MESALEVLSRAATMVNADSDNGLTINKELPTTKWRRDRRIRLSSEYHNHESVTTIKPLGESNQPNTMSDNNSIEIPLDMSMHTKPLQSSSPHHSMQSTSSTASTVSPSSSPPPPPPPYREPLPGSIYSPMARPSVITQAPKREVTANQEDKESPAKKPLLVADNNCPITESISMVDPVIDEHFRRSLGADYVSLFGKQLNCSKTCRSSLSPPSKPTTPTTSSNDTPADSKLCAATQLINLSRAHVTNADKPCPSNNSDTAIQQMVENVDISVDDHFAKALGDTWKQLQQNKQSSTPSPKSCGMADDTDCLELDDKPLVIDEDAEVDNSMESNGDSSDERNSR